MTDTLNSTYQMSPEGQQALADKYEDNLFEYGAGQQSLEETVTNLRAAYRSIWLIYDPTAHKAIEARKKAMAKARQ